MPTVLLVLVLLLLSSGSQAANTYYVANGGSADCNGSRNNINNPLGTIANGVGCLGPGDTLNVRGGTYNEPVRVVSGTDTGSGLITVQGHPGDSPPLVTGCNTEYQHHYLLKHFHVYNADTSYDSACAVFNAVGGGIGDTFAWLEDIEVEGFGGGSMVFAWANYVTFTRMHIHESLPPDLARRTHCMYLSGHHITVEDSNLHDCPGLGIQSYLDGSYGSWVVTALHDNVFRNNRIYDTGVSSNSTGILLGEGSNNVAYNNVIYDVVNGGSGIVADRQCINCQMYNNTIYHANDYGIYIGANSTGVIVRNNIVYNNNVGAINNLAGGSTTCSNNFNIADNCTPSGNADPHFFNGFHTLDPAVIDHGADLGTIFSTDIDHHHRPTGSGWDLGAYEEGGGSGPPPPTRLRFTTQPQSTPVNQPLPAVVVQAQDASGNLVSSYTQNITLTLNTTVGVVSFASTSVAFVDSQETDPASSGDGGPFPATNAIDGNVTTFWHTKYVTSQPGYPHTLILNLGASYPVNGFRYLPRQDGQSYGTIAHYQLAVSPDGTPGSWGPPVADATFSADTTQKTVMFPEKAGQYVWLQALSELNGNPQAAVAELTTLYNAAGGGCPGALAGPPTQPASGGQASFPGLSVTAPGTACQLVATAFGLTGDTSATFAITGGATHLAFVAQPSTVLLGQTLPPVTVQLLDLANNPFPTTQAVDIALTNCPGASFGGTTSRAANASGLATFNDLSVTTATCPGATLVASAFEMTGATSTPFAVLTTIPNPFLTGEWTPHGVSRHACHGTGGDTNFSSSAPTPHTHTLSCPLPANLLQAGARLEACALVTVTSGGTQLRATLSWLLGGTVLATNTSSLAPPGQTTNAWVCAPSVVAAPLGASVPTYTSFALVEPSFIGGVSRGNAILQPVPRPTNSPLSVALSSQWEAAGDGLNALTLHSMIVGLSQ